MPYQKDSARSGVIHSRIQGGEILAQRPHVAQGGPKGKISKLPQYVVNVRQRFILISFQS